MYQLNMVYIGIIILTSSTEEYSVVVTAHACSVDSEHTLQLLLWEHMPYRWYSSTQFMGL